MMTKTIVLLAALAGVGPGRAGMLEVTVPQAGSWKVETRTEPGPAAGTEVTVVRLTNAAAARPPAFRVTAFRPQRDAHVLWHTDAWYGNLRPEWRDRHQSNVLAGLPLYAVVSTTDRNRLTLAASDAASGLGFSCGNNESGAVRATWTYSGGEPTTNLTIRFLADARDVFWADAVAGASAWMRGFYPPAAVPEAAGESVYSTWYAYHTNVTGADVDRESALAAELGLKSFFLDAGWYMDAGGNFGSATGDWRPSSVRFPEFRALVERVKARGLRFVLWCGLPLVGHAAAAHRRFEGKYLYEHPALDCSVLDPRFPDVREHLIGTLERALDEWNVDGFKVDFMAALNGGPAARPGDGRDIAETKAAARRLARDLHRRLRSRKPDVLLEFTHGHHNPAMRPYCNMIRVGDCAGDIHENRSAIARMRLSVGETAVHSDMLTWGRDDTPEDAARQVLAGLFGTVQHSVKLADAPEGQRRMIAHWADFAKRHAGALRRGAFRPHRPGAGYPVLEGEDTDEVVSAVYQPECAVRLRGDKRHLVVNATGGETLLVEADRPGFAYAFDTQGRRTGIVAIEKGLSRVRVPVSGHLETGVAHPLARTMTALAASTAERPARLRVLFYGQSIVAQGWHTNVMRRLRERFPTAEFEVENRAIGGFTSPDLIRTAESDLYPFYPDLLFFHVYGPLDKYEAIVRKARETTTAEVVLWSSHLDKAESAGRAAIEKSLAGHPDARSAGIRAVAERQGCLYVDLRRQWAETMLKNGWTADDLLMDGVHMKSKSPAFALYSDALADAVLTLSAVRPDETLHGRIDEIALTDSRVARAADGSLTLTFEGNRVVAVADGTGKGRVRVELDGRAPATFPEMYYTTRPSKFVSWMPMIKHVDIAPGVLPVEEDWTLTFLPGTQPLGAPIRYGVVGSVTGPDGEGWNTNDFRSVSGRAMVSTFDFHTWQYGYFVKKGGKTAVDSRPGQKVTWSTRALFADPHDAAQKNGTRTTLVQGCANGVHRLTLRPDGKGGLGLAKFLVYRPAHGSAKGDSHTGGRNR